jgi:GT2 family glycosyltransferase/SAM-dependent methyltransferase
VRLRHVDLRQPLPSFDREADGVYRWYLWWGPRPLGVIEVHSWQLPMSERRLARLIAAAITPAVGDLLHPGGAFVAPLPDAPTSLGSTPLAELLDDDVLERLDAALTLPPAMPVGASSVAVVVCTRNRPEQLRRCLRSLAELSLAPDEIVVVDNASDGDATREVAAEAGVTYVLEPRLGLSNARNTGIASTTSDLVAFTDDDVVVHPEWLSRLLGGFRSESVMSVTGLVLPASLESEAERVFEDVVGGFGRGFRELEFGPEWIQRRRRHTAAVWRIGAGASVAFRRSAFDRVGGFDARLGAGAAGCSEDSELWYRLLAGGWRCRYEPSAVVHHYHRDDLSGLKRQMRAYMRGHVAALAVQWSHTRQIGEARRAMISLPRLYVGRTVRRLWWSQPDPTLGAEVRGYVDGLLHCAPLLRGGVLPAPSDAVGGDGTSSKATLAGFLASNPFPQRRTLGSFYGEKMTAIHSLSLERGVRRVLEVGGGQSGLAAALYPDADILTIDLDPAFGAREDLYRADNRGFSVGDATLLPFADDSVDVVTLFDVLEHIADDGAAISEALRVLRPGGSLLLTTPSESWRFPYYSLYRGFCPTDREVMDEWGHVRRGYRVEELDRLVGAAHDAYATFITPVTVLAHDLSFSHLPQRLKRVVGLALAPLVVSAAHMHRPTGTGTEVALRWTLP